LDDFLENRLDLFGPYEDTIVMGQPHLYHSLLSSLINVGLLEPLAVCKKAEAQYYAGKARLNSVEGFIRQIIGWREFIYQVYHLEMPGYAKVNHFEADLPLPGFYWSGDTDMACIAEAIKNLRQYGVNHHIQRLMITGNFALIAGLDPQAVNQWYRLAYTDAYEWVVTPNVLGMALYADGGLLATKPYAASANYINKMSDCCKQCAYNHRQTTGENACPFNALYWDFLARNYDTLKQNPRMNLVMGLFDKRDPEDMAEIRQRAADIRQLLRQDERV
jgi:deoxyribodipyrimidine photolyase-related protein